MSEVFIIAARRTAIGGFLGSLKSHTATALGSIVIADACSFVNVSEIDAVYMGNVLSAGLGQSPARQAAIGAGLSVHSDCTTINKVCASGMKAVMFGAQQIQSGNENLIVAGGMESIATHRITAIEETS